jgi:type I restriction enzyme S subunit
MEKQKNIPKLRFSGFDGEWERKKLGEVVSNKSNKYNPETDKGSYNCIELEHLATDTGQLLGYVDSCNAGSIKNKFEKGDVLFGKLRPYLKKYLLAPFEGVCSSEIWVITGKSEINEFIYWLIQTNRFIGLANQSSGSKMPRADWDVVSSSDFCFPTHREQQKIASFFTSIDQKISQLKKKKDLLEQYKKGVMQKTFSQEIRFKDDNEQEFPKWEKKKLGEVATFSKGKGISISDTSIDGSTECIRYGELYTYYSVTIDEVKSRTNINSDNLVLSEANDVIIPASGETQIDIATASCVLRSGIALGGDLNIIKSANNGVFLSYYLNNQKKRDIANLAQGISVVHLYSSQLSSLEIDIPTLPEQTKIADFVSTLDDKINHAQKQIEKAETWKKGLLQQMFV